jgi:hypothetical protein
MAAGVLWAQQPKPAEGSVDSSVTVTGRDDSVIPVPAPGNLQDELPLTGLLGGLEGIAPPDPPLVAPVSPPVADIPLPPRGTVLMPIRPRPAVE